MMPLLSLIYPVDSIWYGGGGNVDGEMVLESYRCHDTYLEQGQLHLTNHSVPTMSNLLSLFPSFSDSFVTDP